MWSIPFGFAVLFIVGGAFVSSYAIESRSLGNFVVAMMSFFIGTYWLYVTRNFFQSSMKNRKLKAENRKNKNEKLQA
jgi:uncharacterized membrane protein